MLRDHWDETPERSHRHSQDFCASSYQ
jgi:hypothetical protein